MHPTTANIGERIERSEARYDVAFVGRIDPQKDLPLLFRGLAACARRHTLVVVGDGRVDYVSELQNLVRELGLEDQVSWLGWKSHSDALAVVRESKVVAVTSVVENFCHVALEAIANEAELVLVDRVMSSADFKKHAGVKVVPPTAEDVGSAITFCLQDWSDRVSQRRVDAEQISAICSPQNAAQRLIDFASTVRTNSVSCR
ncbi:glycosyltransferase [Arthrobacter sp. S39]|uniref:glycosyltransferase n=1 Tax=Arthrobacter sp. S39 TaxID=2509720 RepID=UPI001F5E779C|nr:glycosyltransferase [Arthrobacter sp. S39]